MACESITPPRVAAQIKDLGPANAAAVVEALARIERTGDRKFRGPDSEGGPDSYLNLSVPGIVIKYTMIDNGSAFEVTAVRRYVTG